MVADRSFRLERGEVEAGNGWTDFVSQRVRVRSELDDAQAAKTLAHEAAHVVLHRQRNTRSCRGRQEEEAESVAYLISATHGLDTGTLARIRS